MLTQRIIGAFTFRKGVYAEVENDTTFTTTAWIIVIVVAFLNTIGTSATTDIVSWLIGAVAATIFAVIGFAVAAFVISRVGQDVFHANVTFGELVRTLGLAYVWNVIGVFGILSVVSETLVGLLAPVMVLSALAMNVAWLIATKEALDLGWLETIITVITGIIGMFIIVVIGSLLLGLLGLGAGSLGGLLG